MPGIRFDNCKVVVHEQLVQGTCQIWAEPFVRADITSNTYWGWVVDSGTLVLTASAVVAQFLETVKQFPPLAASFTID